ncbi:MAG: hypothetical protein LUD77_10405 [Clostridiales bacterium]|nr:hypothetical protein [Clostridiales bacterium]
MTDSDESRIMTVEYLYEWLEKLMDSGLGDMKIRCEDGYLHRDELGIDSYNNETRIIGMLYNRGDFKVCCELKNDIEKAFERFSIRSSKRYES